MTESEKNTQIKPKINIEDSGPCKKKVSIEIPEQAVKEKLDEQYRELQKDAVLPGFRKGRAPMRLVMKRYGEDVEKQVKLRLLAETSEDALKDEDINPLTDPDIDYENIDLPESGPMKYEFEIEVRPEFELPELEGIEIEKPKTEITDEQITEQIEQMRKRAGIWQPKDGKIEQEDQVIADVTVKAEDETEGQKEDNTEIVVRANGFAGPVPVENLDKLLKGKTSGDKVSTTVEISTTFWREEYRGKKVDVDIEIKDVKQLIPAELNDEFFERFGVEDEDELRERLHEMRQAQAEREARSGMADQIYKYLLDNTKLDLPANIVAQQSVSILQRQYSNLLMRGTPKEQVDEQMESLRAGSEQQAREQLQLFFIMDKIAQKFDIDVTEEEINGHIAMAAAQRGRRPEKLREELARDGSLAQFRQQVREEKCIEKLLENASIKETGKAKAKKSEKAKSEQKQEQKKTASKPKKEDTDKSENKSEKETKSGDRKETEKKRTKKKTSKDKKEK